MEIFVKKNEEQVGPFSVGGVKNGVRDGTFAPTDLAWYEGQETWLPIDQIIDIKQSPKTATPPLPEDGNSTTPPPVDASLPSKTGGLNSGIGGMFGMEDSGELGFGNFLSQFKSLDYRFLLPFKVFFQLLALRKKAVRWVLFFGLVPLLTYVLAFKFGLSFTETVWIFEIYFCLFWGMYFQSLIQPQAGIWKRAIGYAAFTVLIGIPVDFLFQSLPIIRNLFSGVESGSMFARLLGCILGVGILEEAIKAMPLIIFVLFKGKQITARDGLFLGFITGLGFAAQEGVMYSFGASSDASKATADLADAAFTVQILQIMFRFMSGTLLHGVWSGIMGWFIGVASTDKPHRWQIVCVGLGLVAFLHGINDFFAGSVTHLVIAAASIVLFMSYIVHDEPAAAPVNASTPQPE